MSLPSLPQKVYSNRPLRFLRISTENVTALNGLKSAGWRGLRDIASEKPSGRATACGSYIVPNFWLEKVRKQPYFEKNSVGMEDGDRRLRKGISES